MVGRSRFFVFKCRISSHLLYNSFFLLEQISLGVFISFNSLCSALNTRKISNVHQINVKRLKTNIWDRGSHFRMETLTLVDPCSTDVKTHKSFDLM